MDEDKSVEIPLEMTIENPRTTLALKIYSYDDPLDLGAPLYKDDSKIYLTHILKYGILSNHRCLRASGVGDKSRNDSRTRTRAHGTALSRNLDIGNGYSY